MAPIFYESDKISIHSCIGTILNLFYVQNKKIKKMRHRVKTDFEPLFKNLLDLGVNALSDNARFPAVNISESEKEYELEFAIAGYQKEDLKINLEHDTLTVSAKIEAKPTDEDKKFTRKEYASKSFSRSFHLPEQVKEKDIQASYENGILKLNLPKAVKAKAKEIVIN
jgi:HSP20 family protein